MDIHVLALVVAAVVVVTFLVHGILLTLRSRFIDAVSGRKKERHKSTLWQQHSDTLSQTATVMSMPMSTDSLPAAVATTCWSGVPSQSDGITADTCSLDIGLSAGWSRSVTSMHGADSDVDDFTSDSSMSCHSRESGPPFSGNSSSSVRRLSLNDCVLLPSLAEGLHGPGDTPPATMARGRAGRGSQRMSRFSLRRPVRHSSSVGHDLIRQLDGVMSFPGTSALAGLTDASQQFPVAFVPVRVTHRCAQSSIDCDDDDVGAAAPGTARAPLGQRARSFHSLAVWDAGQQLPLSTVQKQSSMRSLSQHQMLSFTPQGSPSVAPQESPRRARPLPLPMFRSSKALATLPHLVNRSGRRSSKGHRHSAGNVLSTMSDAAVSLSQHTLAFANSPVCSACGSIFQPYSDGKPTTVKTTEEQEAMDMCKTCSSAESLPFQAANDQVRVRAGPDSYVSESEEDNTDPCYYVVRNEITCRSSGSLSEDSIDEQDGGYTVPSDSLLTRNQQQCLDEEIAYYVVDSSSLAARSCRSESEMLSPLSSVPLSIAEDKLHEAEPSYFILEVRSEGDSGSETEVLSSWKERPGVPADTETESRPTESHGVQEPTYCVLEAQTLDHNVSRETITPGVSSTAVTSVDSSNVVSGEILSASSSWNDARAVSVHRSSVGVHSIRSWPPPSDAATHNKIVSLSTSTPTCETPCSSVVATVDSGHDYNVITEPKHKNSQVIINDNCYEVVGETMPADCRKVSPKSSLEIPPPIDPQAHAPIVPASCLVKSKSRETLLERRLVMMQQLHLTSIDQEPVQPVSSMAMSRRIRYGTSVSRSRIESTESATSLVSLPSRPQQSHFRRARKFPSVSSAGTDSQSLSSCLRPALHDTSANSLASSPDIDDGGRVFRVPLTPSPKHSNDVKRPSLPWLSSHAV